MKNLFIIFLLVFSMRVFGQTGLSKNISDDGKNLHIKINCDADSKKIHYHQQLSVDGLNKDQKDELVSNIVDSLLLTVPQQQADISKKIKDNSSIMDLQITIETKKLHVHYDEQFNVRDKTQIQKDSLINHVTDSLKIRTAKKVIS